MDVQVTFLKLFDCYRKSKVWIEAMHWKAKQHHKDILTNISSGQIADLDTFYDAASQMRKPKRRGKMLKDEKKKRTAQKKYQRDTKGDAFIDNDPLFNAAAKAVKQTQPVLH